MVMEMRREIEVWIQGLPPGLLHDRMTEEAKESTRNPSPGKKARVVKTAAGEAEAACYLETDTGLAVHPGPAILSMMRQIGRNFTQKSSRRSLAYIVPAAARVSQLWIELYGIDRKTRLDADSHIVYDNVVRNQVTKARIAHARALYERWAANFTLVINENIMPEDEIRMLLKHGGECIGIGAFRPECGGPFGLFDIVSWDGRDASKLDDVPVGKDAEPPKPEKAAKKTATKKAA